MNNRGNISFNNDLSKRSNLSIINSKAPVSATANSRIQLSSGDFDIQETIISTEVTASNPSVAAARATAKAASIATSTLTSGNRYISQNDLQKNFTFQISTFCTIQPIKPDLCEREVCSDAYSNVHSADSENEPSFNNGRSGFQRGTKFERLRREIESMEQNQMYHQSDLSHDYHIDSLNKSSRLSNFSTLSNRSTSSSLKSEPVTYHSILSEPLTYSSDNNNPYSYETNKNRSNRQKNVFLNSELDYSDSNSNSKKTKISDLKRSDKINNFDGKLKEISVASNINRDTNSLYCLQTKPGISLGKSFTLNRDIGTMLSNSSSMLETDLDSVTLSTGNAFPQTDFYGDTVAYSFEKTRSMIDIRKGSSDVSYNDVMARAISSEDLKKPRQIEENNLVTRLKSKAQSTQELRIADSLTKLNVPEWMKDFKTNDFKSSAYLTTVKQSVVPLADNSTWKYKDIKRHDSILSKYKYDSLPASRESSKTRELSSRVNPVNLPSSLYRSRSQNLVYFNPKEESKLRLAMGNLSSSLKSLNDANIDVSKHPEPVKEEKPIQTCSNKTEETKIIDKIVEVSIKTSESNRNKVEQCPDKRDVLSRQNHDNEVQFKNFEEKDSIVMQSKRESQLYLQKIIDSTLNPFLVIDDVCTAFRINPATLKLLLNVKRKTPNLNRDDTFLNMKLNESSYIENPLRKNENNKYVISCDVKSCKNELFHSSKVSRTTCSCYNCYTYYCSKKCRNMGFSVHFHACSFKRIREMLLKIKGCINEQQTNALSKYANETYKSFGRGVMAIAFESCRSADDFLNKQPNRLMSQPYYIKMSDMLELSSPEFMDYDPQKEFVICLIICATLPMTNVELSYPTFKYCYRVTYKFESSIKANVISETINHYRDKEDDAEKTVNISNEKSDQQIRREFFDYINNFFETKNVNLCQSYSSIYKKLETFMLKGILFEPLTVYIKDPLINSTVSCTIFPNKEVILKPVRTATKSSKSDLELKQNGHKTLAETEI